MSGPVKKLQILGWPKKLFSSLITRDVHVGGGIAPETGEWSPDAGEGSSSLEVSGDTILHGRTTVDASMLTRDVRVGGGYDHNGEWDPYGGASLDATDVISIKNSLYISELTASESGYIYLGVPDGSNYLFKIEVTEKNPGGDVVHTLDASSDLPVIEQGSKSDGQEETFNNYFAIRYSNKTKVDSSTKSFDDGYTGTQRLNFGAATEYDGDFNTFTPAVAFSTVWPATVKIWWVSGGDGRQFVLYKRNKGGPSRLAVSGTVELHGQVKAEDSSFDVKHMHVNGELEVNGDAHLDGQVFIEQSLEVASELKVGGRLKMFNGNTLDMYGGDITGVKSLRMNGTLEVENDSKLRSIKPLKKWVDGVEQEVYNIGTAETYYDRGCFNRLRLGTPVRDDYGNIVDHEYAELDYGTLGIVLSNVTGGGSVVNVNNMSGSTFAEQFQAAVDEVEDGGVIVIPSGEYTLDGDYHAYPRTSKNLTILGVGKTRPVITVSDDVSSHRFLSLGDFTATDLMPGQTFKMKNIAVNGVITFLSDDAPVTSAIFEDCYFGENSYVNIHAVENLLVDNCQFHNDFGAFSKSYEEWSDHDLKEIVIRNCTSDEDVPMLAEFISIRNGADNAKITIENCYIHSGYHIVDNAYSHDPGISLVIKNSSFHTTNSDCPRIEGQAFANVTIIDSNFNDDYGNSLIIADSIADLSIVRCSDTSGFVIDCPNIGKSAIVGSQSGMSLNGNRVLTEADLVKDNKTVALRSSTQGSSKVFRISIDDTGALKAAEWLPVYFPGGSDWYTGSVEITKIAFIPSYKLTEPADETLLLSSEGEPDVICYRYGTELIITTPEDASGIGVLSGNNMFHEFTRLVDIDLGSFDTRNVTDMHNMFYDCDKLATLDLRSFDTGNVTDMSAMFISCGNLTHIDLSNFNTSNVTDMCEMFDSCSSLTSIDLSNFDTSNVTDISYLVRACESLTSLDLRNFNTSNVTNIYKMFNGCTNLTNLTLGDNFDTSKVDDMECLFQYCNKLTTLDLSSFDTSKVKWMCRMFENCESLTSLDISSFNTSNVETMEKMFCNCRNLASLDLSSFNTGNVDTMEYMFSGCNKLATLDLSSFDTSNVRNMQYMFSDCYKLATLSLGDSFNTDTVTNMRAMFKNCQALTSLDLSTFDTSNVTSMVEMFYNCNKLATLDLSSFDTSNVTDMAGMFTGCNKLTSLDLSSFDTSNVTNMGNMFNCCNALTSIVFGNNFDTSKVTHMGNMFVACNHLTNLDLSNWDTSSVTHMGSMFSGCSSLVSLDLSGSFDLSKLVWGDNMFAGCTELTNLSIGGLIKYSDFSLMHSSKLTHDSLMNVINALYDGKLDGVQRRLVLGSANLAKLTTAEKAIMTNKKWFYS